MDPVTQTSSGLQVYEISLYLFIALIALAFVAALFRSTEFRRDVALTLLLIGVIFIGLRSLSASLGIVPATAPDDLPFLKGLGSSFVAYPAITVIGIVLIVALIQSSQFRRDALLFLLLGGIVTAGLVFLANGLGIQAGTLSMVLIAAFIVIYIRKTWLF
jgi:hypothetical protein